jgi:HSP20 family protein
MFNLMAPWRAKRAERALAAKGYPPFELLRREFAPLFNRAFAGWPFPFESPWEMMEPWGLAMEEKGPEVVIRAEMPGFEASELDVQLTGDLLTIRAEHKEVPGKEGKPIERPHGRLERTLTLPEGIMLEKVTACYRNGVLEVHVPKTPEAQPLRIEVKT